MSPHPREKVIHQEPNLDIAELVTESILLPAVLRAALYPFHQVNSPTTSKMPTAATMMTVEVASGVPVSSRKNLLRPFIPLPPALTPAASTSLKGWWTSYCRLWHSPGRRRS